MDQEFDSLPLWSSFQSIVIFSNSTPIRNEWLPSQVQGTTNLEPIGNNFDGILSDFVVDLLTGQEIRSSITYVPTAQYRYIDLLSNAPLSIFDATFRWRDIYDNYYPILIPQNQVATIKILFQKKKTLLMKY